MFSTATALPMITHHGLGYISFYPELKGMTEINRV